MNIIAILLTTFLFSCNQAENPASASGSDIMGSEAISADGSDSDKKGAIQMTKTDFLEKVMDYENNATEWNYLGDKPALIDFYADWCGPCKIASPVLDELAEEYHGKIYVYKVDTDVERELASVFGIRSIPSFLFIPVEGQPTMSSGIAQTPEQTKEMFKKIIDEILLGKAAEEV